MSILLDLKGKVGSSVIYKEYGENKVYATFRIVVDDISESGEAENQWFECLFWNDVYTNDNYKKIIDSLAKGSNVSVRGILDEPSIFTGFDGISKHKIRLFANYIENDESKKTINIHLNESEFISPYGDNDDF